MNLETILSTKPPVEWVARQAVVFDWHDGPCEGVVRLERPECEFFFQLLAEKAADDDLDDRLFRISAIPQGTVDNVLKAIRPLGTPANAIWIPVWRFTSEGDLAGAEQKIKDALSGKRQTDLVVWTRDMETFLGCWHAERNGTPVANWFARLGIAT